MATGDFIAAMNNIVLNISPSITAKHLEVQGWHSDFMGVDFAQAALDAAQVAQDKAYVATNTPIAVAAAQTATDKANSIQTLSVFAQTLVAGSSASVAYNSSSGVLTIGVPKGDKGDRGDAFNVDSIGTLAQRSNYDNQPEGYAFVATDTGEIYFRLTATAGVWSNAVPFGKGDKGDAGESVNLQVAAGNIIQWQHSGDGAVWTDLVDLNAVYASTFLALNDSGDKADLNTKDKATIVGAINEVNTVAKGASFKNKIVNGDNKVWQRGTSFTLIAGNYGYTADMVKVALSASAVSPLTVSKVTSVNGVDTLIKIASTDALGADASMSRKIEDATQFSGRTVTYSFEANASSIFDYPFGVYIHYGDGGSVTEVIHSEPNVTVTGTQAKYEFTFTVPDLSAKTFGKGNHIGIETGFPTTGAFEFYQTNVQFEISPVATEFEHLPIDIVKQRCYRYCFAMNKDAYTTYPTFGWARVYSAINIMLAIELPVPMRDKSSISLSTGGASKLVYRTGVSNYTLTSISVQNSVNGERTLLLDCISSGMTLGSVGSISSINDNSSYLIFENEL